METTLLYGKDNLTINVPEDTLILKPNNIPGVADEIGSLREALKAPIGSPPLREMVNSKDRVAIVISDITRPTPNEKLVPALIEELKHVPLENFVIINGTGTHRDQTREEFVHMLGEWVVDNVRIINNSCHDKENTSKSRT